MASQESDNVLPTNKFWQMNSGQLSIILTIVGAIGAGIWQGATINATLAASIAGERDARVTEYAALQKSVDQLTQDVREMRSYVMVRAQFSNDGRK